VPCGQLDQFIRLVIKIVIFLITLKSLRKKFDGPLIADSHQDMIYLLIILMSRCNSTEYQSSNCEHKNSFSYPCIANAGGYMTCPSSATASKQLNLPCNCCYICSAWLHHLQCFWNFNMYCNLKRSMGMRW